ncbi:hypothetical protein J1N35_013484 [Gossypium stocksii]|uniref:GAG-pre-integrase domain-containing protein n=1 Tax=Gossypium stocksii TaxID=47602 RepID=A0A9D3VTU5_9ROSI|nr:hypothetical protein J1N35_013484 [Gossypium stocksii]
MVDFLEVVVEDVGLVILSLNVSYVDELAILSRSAIIDLMKLLRVFLTTPTNGSKQGQCLSSSLNTKAWYPDSEESNHVTNDLDNLKDATTYTSNHKLYMRNRVPVPVAYVGSGHFTVASIVFHLKNVLHVPRICKKLLFVTQFAKDNQIYFEFHLINYFVKDIKTWSILLVGHIHNNLYKFDLSASPRANTALSSPATVYATRLKTPTTSTSVFDLWHNMLGHLCNKTVTSVLQKCNIVASNDKQSLICSAC